MRLFSAACALVGVLSSWTVPALAQTPTASPAGGESLSRTLSAASEVMPTEAGVPAFPNAMDLADVPMIAEARRVYRMAVGPAWAPAHRVRASAASNKKGQIPGRLFCGKAKGAAEVILDQPPGGGAWMSNVRVLETACRKSGLTKGMVTWSNGTIWIGDIVIHEGWLNPDLTGQGVQANAQGDFWAQHRDNPEGWVRAAGAPDGSMLVSLESRGLMMTEFIGQRRVASRTVRTRLVLPGAGYIDGISDAFDGFAMGGFKPGSSARAGRYPVGYVVPMNSNFAEDYVSPESYVVFTALDGAFQMTGRAVWVDMPDLSPDARARRAPAMAIRIQSDGNGTRIQDRVRHPHFCLLGTKTDPLRVETFVRTRLGPPGLYQYYGNCLKPGQLPSAIALEPITELRLQPETVADPAEVMRRQRGFDDYYASNLAKANWPFARQNERNSFSRGDAAATYASEQARDAEYRRQERAAQAARHAAIMGAFGDVAQSFQRGAAEMQRSQAQVQATINGQSMTATQRAQAAALANGGGGGTASSRSQVNAEVEAQGAERQRQLAIAPGKPGLSAAEAIAASNARTAADAAEIEASRTAAEQRYAAEAAEAAKASQARLEADQSALAARAAVAAEQNAAAAQAAPSGSAVPGLYLTVRPAEPTAPTPAPVSSPPTSRTPPARTPAPPPQGPASTCTQYCASPR